MRKSLSSENSKGAGSQGLRVASRLLTYLTIGSLFCACIILSILLKGAKEAHHELWEELLEQEKKTANAYQDVASDKVIVVDAEEKANSALRELSLCKQDLEWSRTETNQGKKKISVLENEKSGLSIKVKEYGESRNELLGQLEQCETEKQALKENTGKAVEMIDDVIEEERSVDHVLHPRRKRRRRKSSPQPARIEDRELEESQQITYN